MLLSKLNYVSKRGHWHSYNSMKDMLKTWPTPNHKKIQQIHCKVRFRITTNMHHLDEKNSVRVAKINIKNKWPYFYSNENIVGLYA